VIEVTRLNGLPLVVNADLIKFVEATPDTLISLTTGEKVMVKEAVQLVTERVLDYRKRCASRGVWEPGDRGVEAGVSALECRNRTGSVSGLKSRNTNTREPGDRGVEEGS
jgi:flagellar protein FlbD